MLPSAVPFPSTSNDDPKERTFSMRNLEMYPANVPALPCLPRTLWLLRECQGLSQTQLALRMGVNRQSVSRWEIGRPTTVESSRRLSLGLRVPVWLILCLAEARSNVPAIRRGLTVSVPRSAG